MHSLEFFTCCFLFTKCYPGLARPNEFLIVRQRYRFLQTLWSHPSLNTLYKIIFFCLLESYLPLSILSFDMVKILSYSAFECPLYCQNSAWILNYTESNLELITISFGVWKNLSTYECFDSFVFILSHWKMHTDVIWIKIRLFCLQCLIYNDNPVIHTVFTILLKNNSLLFFFWGGGVCFGLDICYQKYLYMKNIFLLSSHVKRNYTCTFLY